MPTQPNPTPGLTDPENRITVFNTAVKYILIGIYDKLFNPPELPRLLSTFTTLYYS